ncbi:endonuclease/exonuclease/phosphatase family protein [Siccirubricoccus deserti]
MEITAAGGEDWIGWVELKTEPVNARALDNTARIIALLRADVLAVIEAESRPALRRFATLMLPGVGFDPADAPEEPPPAYPRVMLVDGNDDRGIDVGLLAGEGFAIHCVTSHVDDRDAKGRLIFSRDCPEYEVALPGGGTLHLLVNHFKSQGFGGKAASDAKRLAQAERVRALYEARLQANTEFVAVLGDLNDRPESAPLAPLLGNGGPRDVSTHPGYQDDGRPGTWRNGTAANKLDYILLSPALWDRVEAAGVERRGVWGGTRARSSRIWRPSRGRRRRPPTMQRSGWICVSEALAGPAAGATAAGVSSGQWHAIGRWHWTHCRFRHPHSPTPIRRGPCKSRRIG